MNVFLLSILILGVGMIGFGALLGRLVGNSSDFFVAGRRLGPGLLFATILAANIGAGSTIAASGVGYRDGIGAWWWVGSAGLGTLVLGLWVGPRIWALATEKGYLTVGDFLEDRYGAAVRLIIAVLLWLGTLAILAGQLIALAVLLNVVAGTPMWVGAVLGGAVIVVYFTTGGLAGAARVNAVQLAFLLAGFLAATFLAIGQVGGLNELFARAGAVDPGLTSFVAGGGANWRYLFLLAPAFIISPGLIQKVYGARDIRAIRLGVGLSAVALMIFAFGPALLGMVARLHHPDLLNSEQALPILLVQDVPVAVGVLGLAALFVADLSSADAILFMLATSLSQDLYKRHFDPLASDEKLLSVARAAAIGGGALGTVMAVVLPSVIGALQLFYSLLSVSLFVPVVTGLYSRRFGKPEALAAILAGVAVTGGVQLGTGGTGFFGFTPTLLGLLSATVAGLLVLGLRPRSQR